MAVFHIAHHLTDEALSAVMKVPTINYATAISDMRDLNG